MKLDWKSLSLDDALSAITSSDAAENKKRHAAYDRIAENNSAAASMRKTRLTVAENATFKFPLIEGWSGVTIIEIIQKPHSQLTFTALQQSGTGMLIVRAFLEEGAQLNSFVGIVGGESGSVLQETFLNGRGSRLVQRNLFFGEGAQVIDMFSKTIQNAPETEALISAKGILQGESQAQFDGLIQMKETAKAGVAHLIEHTLLLSPNARINALPGLKIETNDVKASHSASVTRIDEEQLLYCQSRGIDEETAVRLIAEGFLKELFEGLPVEKILDPVIRDKLCRK